MFEWFYRKLSQSAQRFINFSIQTENAHYIFAEFFWVTWKVMPREGKFHKTDLEPDDESFWQNFSETERKFLILWKKLAEWNFRIAQIIPGNILKAQERETSSNKWIIKIQRNHKILGQKHSGKIKIN